MPHTRQTCTECLKHLSSGFPLGDGLPRRFCDWINYRSTISLGHGKTNRIEVSAYPCRASSKGAKKGLLNSRRFMDLWGMVLTINVTPSATSCDLTISNEGRCSPAATTAQDFHCRVLTLRDHGFGSVGAVRTPRHREKPYIYIPLGSSVR